MSHQDSTSTLPSVAIVILNYNGRKHLETFLPSVVATSYPNASIIIADNASTDDSVDFLKKEYRQLRLIELTENYGFAEGYNQALQQVKADYYVLLNSDVEVTPNWVEPVIELMESDQTIGVAQPKILAHYDKSKFEHAGGMGGMLDKWGYPFCKGRIFAEAEIDKGQYDETSEVFWAVGAALFIKGELYHKIGGLDGSFFAHMEEIDLCWRIKRAGYKVMAIPSSVVYHLGGGTLPTSSPRKTYLNFRNNLKTLTKNETFGKLLWLIPLRLVLDGLAAVLFLKEGKFNDILAILKAHFHFYGSIFKVIKQRKLDQRNIELCRIGQVNNVGRSSFSVVVQFYLKNRKTYAQINNNE